ncbi:MAG TPA: hypothetical protein PLL20_21740 [Phycisphaerae bacterium]|nr:hypothetical protein [Phycisphaerae bacterium]HRR86408.1 hypothetical protein [Phycisphaerae bacterium]
MDENTTPAVSYTWDTSHYGENGYNYDRLVGMTYPTRPETGARSLWEIGGHYTYFDEIGAVFRCKLRRSAWHNR